MKSLRILSLGWAICAGSLLAVARPAHAQPAVGVLADLRDMGPRQVKSASFSLTSVQDVQIEALGAESSDTNRKTIMGERDEHHKPVWRGNAWILDIGSRKAVWELSGATTTRGAKGAREFNGAVRLPPGSYTAYYASFPDGEYWSNENGKTARKWHWFGDEPIEQFKFIVRGTGRLLSQADVDRARHPTNAFVSLRGAVREAYEQAGFVLSRPTDIGIVVEGEAREDGEFDFGWIINADTRATVWRFSWRDSQPAGGAVKNRVERTSRLLPAGRYAAFYATDDSHDPSEWNTQPPYDPESWGMTLTTKDAASSAAVRTFHYEHVADEATIVALTHVGNEAAKKAGFTLSRPMDVRIYALGEGRNGRMFDFGWITRADSPTRVWDMRYGVTEPAGGDQKNRRVDTVIHLDAGNYIVHYISDDSHSAEEWNAAAPPDGRRWGITLLAAHPPLDRSAVGAYDPKANPAILAQLVEVRDDEQMHQGFTLDRETDVRIYALGEGSGGDMADYGWIEDARTGRRVWEMTYRTTEHAGGAAKNRRFDGVIKLPAGEYVLRYESDGSHSFGDWNADPPDDPDLWGITVYRR